MKQIDQNVNNNILFDWKIYRYLLIAQPIENGFLND